MAKDRVRVLWLGDELGQQIEGASDDALYEGGDVILRSAVARAPKRKGRLAASGYIVSASRSSYAKSSRTARRQLAVKPGVAAVAFAEFYARFLEGGTKGHVVKPKRRRALQTSAACWAARAKVKGIQGKHFLASAADSEKEAAVQRIVAVIQGRIG